MSQLKLKAEVLTGESLLEVYDTIEIINRFSELQINLFAYCKFRKMKLYKMLSLLESNIDYRKYMDMYDNESINLSIAEEGLKLKTINNNNFNTVEISKESILDERLRIRQYEKKEIQKLRKLLKLTDLDLIQYIFITVEDAKTGNTYKLPAIYTSLTSEVAANAIKDAFFLAFGFVMKDLTPENSTRSQYAIFYLGQKPQDINIIKIENMEEQGE